MLAQFVSVSASDFPFVAVVSVVTGATLNLANIALVPACTACPRQPPSPLAGPAIEERPPSAAPLSKFRELPPMFAVPFERWRVVCAVGTQWCDVSAGGRPSQSQDFDMLDVCEAGLRNGGTQVVCSQAGSSVAVSHLTASRPLRLAIRRNTRDSGAAESQLSRVPGDKAHWQPTSVIDRLA